MSINFRHPKLHYLLSSICIITFNSLPAQGSLSEDSLKLAQALEWLESKLTYNYYNIDDEEWWVNRFTYNDANEAVTIKNIASPQLQSVSDKTYLQLNFKLKDLNPYTISIINNEKNTGRLVAGKIIRIGAYHHEKSITKTRNGQISSSISFIYISIPKHYEDSTSNYSQEIASKLKEAITLSSRVYPRRTPTENYSFIKAIIIGDEFISEEKHWSISSLFADVIEIEVKDNQSNLIEKRYLHFLDSGLELTIIKPNTPTQVIPLKQEDPKQLTFKGENHQLAFTTMNEFSYMENGKTLTFIRD